MNRRDQINEIRLLQQKRESRAGKVFIAWFIFVALLALGILGITVYVILELLWWVTSK